MLESGSDEIPVNVLHKYYEININKGVNRLHETDS